MKPESKVPKNDLGTYRRRIDADLLQARNAETNSDTTTAAHCYASYVRECLAASVNCLSSSSDGIEFMQKMDVPRYLGQALKLNLEIISAPTNNEPIRQIELSHVAWLTNEFVLGELNSNLCIKPQVVERSPSTKSWNEYCRAMSCFIRRDPYEPSTIKVKGYERYWQPYLLLIEKVTKGLETLNTIAVINESFKKRNADRRLIDWEYVDGDGSSPVKWDFRLASFQIAVRHYYNREL
jgi:hypothetical protein